MGFLKIPRRSRREDEKAQEKASADEANTQNVDNAASRNVSAPGSTDESRPVSFYPPSNYSGTQVNALDVKADVMCNWLYQQQLERAYATGLLPWEGVVIKKTADNYACHPPELRDMPDSLYDMAMGLNVRCAMTVNTRVINCIMSSRRIHQSFIPLPRGLNLQVLGSIRELPHCMKHHFAAFIEDSKSMVVWADDPKSLLHRADELEQELMQMIWNTGDEEEEVDEKGNGVTVNVSEDEDLEAARTSGLRRFKLTSPMMVGLTIALCLACVGLGLRALALEIATDGDYTRLALVAVIPAQILVSLFFFQTIITNFFQLFGPISCVDSNSKFYSGKAPRRLNASERALPHVTIQMPVYKEGLKGVIIPTVSSLKQCISTYELQGGTANIFVNDDGMQLIPEEEAMARREFYKENNIGWVSRPKHNPNPDEGEQPFLRRGKFKKASNMNYGMMISNNVEEKMQNIVRHDRWTQSDEHEAYKVCLREVLADHQGRAWADGNIRMGDYILIIDSDTRVPSDCLLDAVSEMEEAPEVAILQYTSGVMRVTTSFFEAAITWFTGLIYAAITFAVANGDSPAFVGHNAFLRWSAVQDAAAFQDEDGYEKYWSESHVSEDFDMSLRLQCAGYIIRFATYTGEGFKEGVSLTVYDELARWEKYAFGCNELMFHPFKYWLTKGPITPLFWKFLGSGIHLHKKFTICAYIFTYYAIGAAWILTLMNYFVTGWFFGLFDKFYLDSFAIYISLVVVFAGFGNIALAILRYRLGEKGLLRSFWDNLKWIPVFSVFFGGLSLHLSQALLCHFFGIDLQWGATSKEYEEVNFLEEVPRLIKAFKGTFLFSFGLVALMICGKYAFPEEWRIVWLASIYPLANVAACHFLLPVALNPALMVFAW